MNGKMKILTVIAGLTLLVPLGILTDAPAWGEWDNSYYEKVLGFVPQGIREGGVAWKIPLPDYSVAGMGEVAGYYLSALAGLGVILAVYLLIRRYLRAR